MEFKREIDEKVKLVEDALKIYLKSADNPQKAIYDAMEYSLMAGGKRLRPVIMLMVSDMCGGKYERVLPFAAAMEMIHTYSLIHDDLPAMDNDDLRRGKPTNHKVFGEDMAILAGDALLNRAMETALLAEVPDDVKVRALKVLFHSTGTEGMIGGQVIDIKNTKHTHEELLNLHLLKTGAIIRSSGVLGGILSGADDSEIDAIDYFCKNLGIAFQIQDDLLDVLGNESELGKPVGSDMDNEKTTYVTLFGVEKSKELVKDYTDKAKEKLVEKFGDKASKLLQLADFLVGRKI